MKIYLIKESKITDELELLIIAPIFAICWIYWNGFCGIECISSITVLDFVGPLMQTAIFGSCIIIPMIVVLKNVDKEVNLKIPEKVINGFKYTSVVIIWIICVGSLGKEGIEHVIPRYILAFSEEYPTYFALCGIVILPIIILLLQREIKKDKVKNESKKETVAFK